MKKSSQKQKTHFILALTFKRLIPLLCPIGELALLDLIKKKGIGLNLGYFIFSSCTLQLDEIKGTRDR